ncbi:uncharacterized protein LOC110111965 [Dendrobium catenatum]|uniref:uncharacterized protein LOC110111965 n=1 Tax=Dendrobium catenatum TaxID=906689 RepID=UPI0009F6F68D|nr:uncharacterized protein LOC110111965 [Dendrobium catenatum]
MRRLLQQLQAAFNLKQLGSVNTFIGIQIQRTPNGLFLHQAPYARDLLQSAGFSSCNPALTPLATKSATSSLPDQPLADPNTYRKSQELSNISPLQDPTSPLLPFIKGNIKLKTFVDADWAADRTDRKSITGFCSFLGPNLISWQVKKQVTVSKSSTEVEYHALSSATSEVIWLRRLLAELNLPQLQPTAIHCNNHYRKTRYYRRTQSAGKHR